LKVGIEIWGWEGFRLLLRSGRRKGPVGRSFLAEADGKDEGVQARCSHSLTSPIASAMGPDRPLRGVRKRSPSPVVETGEDV
jgi:hypothetical protein